jgi:hypothetical protein
MCALICHIAQDYMTGCEQFDSNRWNGVLTTSSFAISLTVACILRLFSEPSFLRADGYQGCSGDKLILLMGGESVKVVRTLACLFLRLAKHEERRSWAAALPPRVICSIVLKPPCRKAFGSSHRASSATLELE